MRTARHARTRFDLVRARPCFVPRRRSSRPPLRIRWRLSVFSWLASPGREDDRHASDLDLHLAVRVLREHVARGVAREDAGGTGVVVVVPAVAPSAIGGTGDLG